ncbi:hypothetical protein B9Q03_12085 [Candidatus Marsarchaeota G2 archaeon OSP_D]|jgi:ParB-like nuclease domain.|uniref:ParB-like N-terminal domain-containing protein n=1 Tax=Candidatus Marsarchaeota G2 archaeon OSP_D TaxID=1978157 RepID=A0A2R6AHF0_9ARCH|nr:MAG: hypothetical protein B9Q03_12085 [Candidatus Marsarchaeota G2 archaeon OSP_D]
MDELKYGKFVYKIVPLSSLIPWEKNPRKLAPAKKQEDEQPEHQDEDLERGIKSFGLINPLIVTDAEEEGKYLVISGNRRLEALRASGADKVVVAYRPMSEDEKYLVSLQENLVRADAKQAYAILLADFVEERGKKIEEIAKEFGLSESTVRTLVNMGKTLKELGEKDLKKVLNSKPSMAVVRAAGKGVIPRKDVPQAMVTAEKYNLDTRAKVEEAVRIAKKEGKSLEEAAKEVSSKLTFLVTLKGETKEVFERLRGEKKPEEFAEELLEAALTEAVVCGVVYPVPDYIKEQVKRKRENFLLELFSSLNTRDPHP